MSVLLTACGGEIEVADPSGGTGGSGGVGGGNGSGGTGGGNGTTPSGASVTWCDVAPMLNQQCWSCHGATPNAGAPRLTTIADLTAASSRGGTELDRCILRMTTTPAVAAMPPGFGGNVSDVQLLTDWRAAGMPDCADGGTPSIDAGPAPETCTSGAHYSFGYNRAMEPGQACISCHTSRRDGPIYGFMGTIYPSLHEEDRCRVTSFPGTVAIEILDSSNTVRATLNVSNLNSGNFMGGSFGVPSPYTARVRVNGAITKEMRTPQTSGDCNTCHTAQGAQGAPGRIVW